MDLQQTKVRKFRTTTLIILAVLFALSFSSVVANASVNVRHQQKNPSGWFVLFHAENEDNFKGEVAHLHIYEGELDRAQSFIREALDITLGVEDGIGNEINVSVGELLSWVLEAAGAVARNEDGSFDIFLMTGAKDFFGVTTPVVFAGFVPDQMYKPPLPAEFISITGIPAANSLGGHFRNRPKP